MDSPITITIQDDIALVSVANPPVNALSQSVRAGILIAINETETDDRVKAVVLLCAGTTFIAGADVREFGKPALEPHLPDVIHALEATSKPWCAALHGSALGGGLEVALGCHYRVAVPNAKLGFPEVNLGLIPGAGGTVRLPRLIDPDIALSMISSGKPVSASSALDCGLVDIIVNDLQSDAICFTREKINESLPKSLASRQPFELTSVEKWDDNCARISARARGQQAPVVAVQALKNALSMNAVDALSAERDMFLTLKNGEQSAALRHVFFAERAVGKQLIKDLPQARSLNQIGVVGGGTMGAGIAAACLLADLSVVMIEVDNAGLARGVANVDNILTGSKKRGLICAARYTELLAQLHTSTDYEGINTADVIIEAVFEDMPIKHEVFRALDKHAKASALLASNTSYLDINEIARVVKDPTRVIGLHFFSPAHIMKLLEVVITDTTSTQSIATGMALGRSLRKITVPAGVCDGFIGNRIMSAYRRECDYMLEDGALPTDIDAAMRNFGFPMGIYEMQDMAGLDIAWAMRKRQAATRNPGERYVAIADALCEKGRFGRKSGSGWYVYENGAPAEDPAVTELILQTSASKNIQRQAISQEIILKRILDVMYNTGQALLAEGIAQSADDIDVVMINGYGFPRWRGGPMYLERRTKS